MSNSKGSSDLRRAILICAALAAAAIAPTASAAQGPPDVRIRASTGSAALNPWTWMWTHPVSSSEPDAPDCATIVADGFPRYGTKARLRQSKGTPMIVVSGSRKPAVRRFHAYSQLDQDGFAKGRGKRVTREVKPLGGDFDRPAAWGITFKVNTEKRRYFDLALGFRDRTGGECNEGGDAWYSFGVGRLPRKR